MDAGLRDSAERCQRKKPSRVWAHYTVGGPRWTFGTANGMPCPTVVFWGSGAKSNRQGQVVFACPQCGLNTFELFEQYRYGHLYGVRVSKPTFDG